MISRLDTVEKQGRDCKTILQEIVQREKEQYLSYRLIEESGPDHSKVFTVGVFLNSVQVGKGEGHSKKEAEQAAASAALEKLEKRL